MPFQSEKQRRYLWANEPEIARDWTNTYGSRIRKDNGGIMEWADQGGMKNYLGEQPMVNAPQFWRSGPDSSPTELAYVTEPEKNLILQANMHGSLGQGPNEGPSGIISLDSQGDYTPDMSGGGGGGDHEGEQAATQQAAVQKAVLTGKIQKDPNTGNWEAGSNLGKGESLIGLGLGQGPGPKIGGSLAKNFGGSGSRIGGGVGNWASGFAGSKIGGGLGSMLFGPWGALLGALFGGKVGKNIYSASQTEEKESLKDTLLGQNTLFSNLFNKKKTPTIGGEKDFDPNAKISDKSFSLDQGLGGLKPYSSIDETINDYDYKPRQRRTDDFNRSDVTTWFDTHPATGEAVMKPQAQQIYKGSDKLNPRTIYDSYEFMETPNPFKKEAWIRPNTFGQEQEFYPSNQYPKPEQWWKGTYG